MRYRGPFRVPFRYTPLTFNTIISLSQLTGNILQSILDAARDVAYTRCRPPRLSKFCRSEPREATARIVGAS